MLTRAELLGQIMTVYKNAINIAGTHGKTTTTSMVSEILLAASHHLITSDGIMIIKAQEYRSQELNREAALSRLVAVIKELTAVQKSRRATRPTRASKERRLSSKAQKSSVKSLRGKVRRPQD